MGSSRPHRPSTAKLKVGDDTILQPSSVSSAPSLACRRVTRIQKRARRLRLSRPTRRFSNSDHYLPLCRPSTGSQLVHRDADRTDQSSNCSRLLPQRPRRRQPRAGAVIFASHLRPRMRSTAASSRSFPRDRPRWPSRSARLAGARTGPPRVAMSSSWRAGASK